MDCPRPAGPERQFYWTLPVVGGNWEGKQSSKHQAPSTKPPSSAGWALPGGANKILVPVCGRVTDPFVIRGQWALPSGHGTASPIRKSPRGTAPNVLDDGSTPVPSGPSVWAPCQLPYQYPINARPSVRQRGAVLLPTTLGHRVRPRSAARRTVAQGSVWIRL